MPCLVCENVIQYIVLDTMHIFYVTLFKKNMVVVIVAFVNTGAALMTYCATVLLPFPKALECTSKSL